MAVKGLLGYIPFTRWWHRRKLIERVIMISPTDTPFLSMVSGKQSATSRVDNWVRDTLSERKQMSKREIGIVRMSGKVVEEYLADMEEE